MMSSLWVITYQPPLLPAGPVAPPTTNSTWPAAAPAFCAAVPSGSTVTVDRSTVAPDRTAVPSAAPPTPAGIRHAPAEGSVRLPASIAEQTLLATAGNGGRKMGQDGQQEDLKRAQSRATLQACADVSAPAEEQDDFLKRLQAAEAKPGKASQAKRPGS